VDFRAASLTVALTLLQAAAPAAAQTAAPTVEDGRRAYVSFCARCHGINLVVSGGAFYDLRRFPAGDKARFMQSVNKGIRAMPAWETIVKPEQLEAIWLYVGSVNGWPAPAAAAVSASGATQTQ
jgi:cytochrome c55X